MYVPHFNQMSDLTDVRALVSEVGAAELVTIGTDGFPVATLLPVMWHDGRLVMHMARANGQWRDIRPGAPALAVLTGGQAYISPAWYQSKLDHGRVVPTWNYSAVHFTGRVTVHQDAEWLLDAVTKLVELHEGRRADPWAVDDAPPPYIRKQLNAIIGIEFAIEKIEAKAKLSQNRSEADRAGVIDGLEREGGAGTASVLANMLALRDIG